MSKKNPKNFSSQKNDKRIFVTTSWDDGHILDLQIAKLLKKYSLKGTFYISPKNREFKTSDLLSDEQVISLSKDFEIGAHTMTHPRLSKLRSDIASAEIRESKQYLENIIKKPVESFCYPGGCYNFLNVHQVKDVGFLLARTVDRFSFNSKNPYELSTSLHAYNHWSDVWRIASFAGFNPVVFWSYYRNWDVLAMAMFDHVSREGGVFHLWGHSWEIDGHKDWNRLKRVLGYISNRPGVSYVENRELFYE